MKKISVGLLAILLCIVQLVSIESTYCDDGNEVMAPAKAMIVMEGQTKKVLFEHNIHSSMAMASTTKIVTAIVAIENYPNLDQIVRVSDKAVGIEGTSIYLKHGEEISMKDLLYGLILASGNDCAVAIAEEVCGVEGFVEKMNNFVTDLGLKDTHFSNPHGLDQKDHYTSAYDLAYITAYALNNDVFREIVSTKYHQIAKTNVYGERYLKHKNKLLFSDENCIGVKTGFTDNAGRCLVNAHEENDMQIITVLFNCGPMFEEAKRLTNMALKNYTFRSFVKPYNYVSTINVENGDKNEIGVATLNGYDDVILKSEADHYRVEYDFPNVVQAPVDNTNPVGKVRVYKGDDVVFEDNLYAIDSCKNIDLKFMLDNILNNWV